MEEITLLFATQAEYDQWIRQHPINSTVEAVVCGARVAGNVSQVAAHYGKVKVRIKLAKE